MRKNLSKFIIPALLYSAIIVILFIIGFVYALTDKSYQRILDISGAVGFVLAVQIVIFFFVIVYKTPAFKASVTKVLIASMFIMLVGAALSLAYTIAGGSVSGNAKKWFAVFTSLFNWVLSFIFLICTVVFTFKV